MKISITGATGFIGINLVEHMLSQGHDVSVLVRNEASARKKFGDRVRYCVGDVSNAESLLSLCKGSNVVIHLAALFNAPEASAEEYKATNVEGTLNILEAAQSAGVDRVVHCSTVGVASEGALPFKENAPYSPPTWDKYETTKCDGEKLAVEYFERTKFPVVIIRPAQVYGPGDLSKLKFYKMVKKGVIVSQGKTLKHLIYIKDLCRAFELACTSDDGFGVPIIIAANEPTPLNQLVKIVAGELEVSAPRIVLPAIPMTLFASAVEVVFNAIGKKPPIFRRSMNFFTKSVAFETGNAQKYLGFESQVATKDGVAATAAWYIENDKL